MNVSSVSAEAQERAGWELNFGNSEACRPLVPFSVMDGQLCLVVSGQLRILIGLVLTSRNLPLK